MRIGGIAKNLGRMTELELLKGTNADVEQLALIINSLHCIQGLIPSKTHRDVVNNLICVANIETSNIQIAQNPNDQEAKEGLAEHKKNLRESCNRFLEEYETCCEVFPIGSVRRNDWLRKFCWAHTNSLSEILS